MNEAPPYVYEGSIDVAPAGVPFSLPADTLQLFGGYVTPPTSTYRPEGGGRFVLTPRTAVWNPRQISSPAVVEIVITCSPATPAPTAAPLMSTARVNITNTCPVPVGILLGSNEANFDVWQQYNPATGTGAPILGNRVTIAPGATQANLLLLNTNPSARVSVLPRSGFITAYNASLPAPSLSTATSPPNQLIIRSFTESIEPNVTVLPGGPGVFVLDPVVVGSTQDPVAPAEVAVNVYCPAFRTTAAPVVVGPVVVPVVVPVVTPAVTPAVPAVTTPVTPLTPCTNTGGGASLECPAVPKPAGTGCVCGDYLGGGIARPSVCQANVQCAQCTRGRNTDADCLPSHSCGAACGGVGPSPAITALGFRGLCLPNCGLNQPRVGFGC